MFYLITYTYIVHLRPGVCYTEINKLVRLLFGSVYIKILKHFDLRDIYFLMNFNISLTLFKLNITFI